MSSALKRIGIQGGTFDPIHNGHLILAECARTELDLDVVIFIPSPSPPHKNSHEISPVSHRLEMLKLVIAEHSHFEISEIELKRPGASYTIDTLRELNASPDFAESNFYFLMGMDSLADFHNWRSPEEIIQLTKLVAYPRSSFTLDSVDARFRDSAIILQSPMIEISSTDIRERIKKGLSIRYFVPESVRLYIEKHGLYRKGFRQAKI